MTLAAFFAHMGPYLVHGRGRLDAIEEAIGVSASGSDRVELVRGLVRAQKAEAMQRAFPAVHRKLRNWHDVVSAYLDEATCRAPHPSGIGVEFADFLARPGIVERFAVPGWATELADYESTRFGLSSAPDHGPEFAVRFYTHDVTYLRSEDVPPVREVSLVMYRNPTSHRVRVVQADAALLIAIGLATGELSEEEARRVDVAAPDRARAEQQLRRMGLSRS